LDHWAAEEASEVRIYSLDKCPVLDSWPHPIHTK
jgi:hypothetical protein